MTASVGSSDAAGVSGPGGEWGSSELGLFVIWPLARRDEREILADLARRFRVITVDEIHWTRALVRRNYERFYSDLEVRGVYHEINKGSGPFLAVTLVDPRPVHAVRDTSRGPREVNTNFLDAKLEYRDRRGYLAVHCSETAAETRRDRFMLLGPDGSRFEHEPVERVSIGHWDGHVGTAEIDVAGSNGWRSERDLLTALDASADYVMLEAPLADDVSLFGGPVVPQLLTADDRSLHTVRTVLNVKPASGRAPRGGRYTVEVGGRRVSLGIRTVDDGYVDPMLARHCLEQRVVDERHVYRPPEPDDVAVRRYLAMVRRRRPTDADRRLARALAIDHLESDRLAARSIGRVESGEVAGGRLSVEGSARVAPIDLTDPHHDGTGVERAVRVVRGGLLVRTNGTADYLRTRWLTARDALVFRAPALRRLVRRLRGRP